jgi:hypothetical protein
MSGEDNKRAVAEFVERCQNQGLLLGKLPILTMDAAKWTGARPCFGGIEMSGIWATSWAALTTWRSEASPGRPARAANRANCDPLT